ncbi:MAG TPA: alpha/beta hydrolase [Bacteroidales bacterium]|nr:alpha/beta hydrolase [Bacteroidales bacterium]
MRKKTFFAFILLAVGFTGLFAQQKFAVIMDKPVNGTVKITPELPADGKYPSGTVVTVKAIPDPGFVLDAVYYTIPGIWGQMYHESQTDGFKITIDQEKHLGASFIEKNAYPDINITHNVVYAKPGIKALKYDVYSPKGAKNLPVIIIIHGGGWMANDEDIMRGMAKELTKDGKFVVFSIDYRWVDKGDGDAQGNTTANLIEDVFGAIAHIMEHAAEYGGDASRIALTGDSAGGHLSAAAANMPNKIGSGGFGKTAGVFEFMPVYIPKNKTLDQLRSEMMKSIKAAAPSYGVFGGNLLNPHDPAATDKSWSEAIAPLSNIPNASERQVPQYLIRGTMDGLITDAEVKKYVDALVKAGQRVEYVQVGGAGHAFFDWKPDETTKATFKKYGVYYIAEMKAFFESVLY